MPVIPKFAFGRRATVTTANRIARPIAAYFSNVWIAS